MSIKDEKGLTGVDIAICNTVISGDLVKLLKNENYKVITLIHELSGTIKAYNAEEKARNISLYSDTIIFPSKYVKDEFKDIVDKMKKRVIHIEKGDIVRDDKKGGYDSEI